MPLKVEEAKKETFYPAYELEFNELSGCCGVEVLTGFGGTSTAGVNRYRKVDEKTIRHNLTRCWKMRSKYYSRYPYAITQVALNNDQVPQVEPILLEFGFKKVADGIHHTGHGKTISIYLRNNREWEAKLASKE